MESSTVLKPIVHSYDSPDVKSLFSLLVLLAPFSPPLLLSLLLPQAARKTIKITLIIAKLNIETFLKITPPLNNIETLIKFIAFPKYNNNYITRNHFIVIYYVYSHYVLNINILVAKSLFNEYFV